jgi:hypothetical protein
MKEVLSPRPPIVEVLFPRTPEVGDSQETIAAQIECAVWAAQVMRPVFRELKQAEERSPDTADFLNACNDATGVSKQYKEHYSALLTPELKEKISWQES